MRKGISSFSAGEVSDLADDRAAIDIVKRGCNELTNGELGRFGQIDKRGGTDDLGALKTGTDWRILSFEFSNFTKFQLEFGSGYVRFWSNDLRVDVTTVAWGILTVYALGDSVSQAGVSHICTIAHTAGSTVGSFTTDRDAGKWYALEDDILEVALPYTGAQIQEFQVQPIQDFLYITHPSHPRKVLKRFADDDWRLEDPGFLGPYEEVGGGIVMTSDGGTGTVALTADGDFFEAGHVGAKIRLFYQQEAKTYTGMISTVWNAATWINPSGVDYSVGDVVYYVVSSNRVFFHCIQAYTRTVWADGTAYVVDNVVTRGGAAYVCTVAHTSADLGSGGDSGAGDNEPGIGEDWDDFWNLVSDPTDAPNHFAPGGIMIGPIYMAGDWEFTTQGTWKGDFQVQTSGDGIKYNTVGAFTNDDGVSNFTLADDQPTPIYLRVLLISTNSNYGELHNITIGQYDVAGIANITAVAGLRAATGEVTTDFYSSGAAKSWEIETFNAVDGYPRAIGFEENKLTFAGSARHPLGKWYSEPNNYTNFVAGTLADSPFRISAIGLDSSPVQWLSSHDGAFMGTASAEATLNGQNPDQAITPENLPTVRWFSNEGSAFIPPVFLNSRLFAVHSSGERINEFAYSIERGFNGGYDPSEASLLADHMLSGGVRQMTIRRMPEKGIWCVLNSGDLVVYTHRPKAKLAGWWRIQTEGTIKSIAISRGDGIEDEVYWAVIRNGVGRMEKMRQGNLAKRRLIETALEAGDSVAATTNSALLGYLDGATTHTGTALTQVTGLTRYASQTVSYVRDGAARTGAVSAGGVLTLDEPADVVLVGLPYTFTVEPRSVEAFSEFGTSMSKIKNFKSVVVSYYLSVGGVAQDLSGTARTVQATQLASQNPLGGALLALQTGQTQVPFSGIADRKKKLRITHSDPSPFTLLGLYVEMREGQIT